MKKAQIIAIGFIGLGLLDSLITFAFPIDFTYVHYSFVPHLVFIGTLVYTVDKPWLNRILISMVIGLGFDLLFAQMFPMNMILFALFGYLAGWIYEHMHREGSLFLIFLGCAFLYDLIPYIIYFMINHSPSLDTWFYKIESLTLLADLISILFLMYIQQVMSRFFMIRQYRERKRTTKKLNQIKTSRK
ncbi:rod shape-determining protein MreD [Dubosiella newyorkensis]|uniref:rod shape-determining protein MreD n=1 Tax=Dubosiella newyorkensis TaxID=1862672 RepID=UPI0023F42FCF|nr:rod shape-determining protein MreD [Dubosiella newyorkensis]